MCPRRRFAGVRPSAALVADHLMLSWLVPIAPAVCLALYIFEFFCMLSLL